MFLATTWKNPLLPPHLWKEILPTPMDVHHTFIFYNYSRKEKNIAPQIALHVSVELINNRNKPIAPRDQACISHG